MKTFLKTASIGWRIFRLAFRASLFALFVVLPVIFVFALTGCAQHSPVVEGPDMIGLSDEEFRQVRRAGVVNAQREFLSWSHKHHDGDGRTHSHFIPGGEQAVQDHIYGPVY